ncbi:DUF4136 domain-containing protein [Flavobacterium sp. NRK1]|jgi:hypothetical protein|uniref:DUF4136 domain-containing protein n=1 Tax=Flavobacterium sp. NRK1 TaxID=2954929 RepID=UPI002092E5A9|nr:DUF4136 domain-containing protein [Flavobacterium sp. NRK1]MCO6148259.1 DUF4136 domain-containing protein [Flavobacterium sp. NRK1]
MKTVKLLSLLFITAIAASCSSIRVNSDYDDNADFNQYKTYGFFDKAIEKAEISDLDKKRILNAIDAEFQKKGFTKSDNPALLVNIFTKASKEVNVNQWGYGGGWGWGWGYGWGPGYWGGNYTSVSTSTEGTLFIDLIDANKKELVWQGVGTGVLTLDRDKKQERINEFVSEIMKQFPPQKKK